MSCHIMLLNPAIGFALIFTSTIFGSVFACSQPMTPGQTVALNTQPPRIVQLADQTIVDNKYQSTLRQAFFITNPEGVSDADIRKSLEKLYENARTTCRKNPLKGTLVFLYLTSDTVNGMNWVGRLDVSSGSTPKIDVGKGLIPATKQVEISSHSRCDRLGTSDTGKKDIRFPDEVDLPPIKDREILGTWFYQNKCTLSFESVKGSVYRVIRCSDCSGGKTGVKVARVSNNVFQRIPQRKGEYFRILPSGNLGSFDDEGEIETYVKQTNGLWP